MRQTSVIKNTMRSPLQEAMKMSPQQTRSKKKIVVNLALTSLVDAFSIMLLYLLVQNSGVASTYELSKTEKLPTVTKAEALHEGTFVRISEGRYFLGEEEVQLVELAAKLQEIKGDKTGAEADSLIIQADKDVDFAMLAPVIRAASVSGFGKYRFAVIQEEAAQ